MAQKYVGKIIITQELSGNGRWRKQIDDKITCNNNMLG